MGPAGRAGRVNLRYAFTERGAAMLSDVFRRNRTIRVNIVIIRTFVRLREILSAPKGQAASPAVAPA